MKTFVLGPVVALLSALLAGTPALADSGSSQDASRATASALAVSGAAGSAMVVGVAAAPVLLLGAAGDAVADDLADASKASRKPLPLGDETVAGPAPGLAPDEELAR